MTRHTGYTEADRLSPMGEDDIRYTDTQRYSETEAGMYEPEKEDYQTPPSSPVPDVTPVNVPQPEPEVTLPKKKKIVKVKVKEVKPPISDHPEDDERHVEVEEPRQSIPPPAKLEVGATSIKEDKVEALTTPVPSGSTAAKTKAQAVSPKQQKQEVHPESKPKIADIQNAEQQEKIKHDKPKEILEIELTKG